MIHIDQIDTRDKRQVRRFLDIPLRLYKDCPQWVPPIRVDAEDQLNRQKHPFFEHSEGEFFIARQDGQDVGRLGVLENRSYNEHHDKREAQFYFFDAENDLEVSRALFDRAAEWAHARHLDTLVGPKGMGPVDGYGLLVGGFEHRQLMTMMNYNYPYYQDLMQALGFEKEVDFISCYLDAKSFHLPERIHHIAQRVQERGTLRVQRFKNKRHLMSWVGKIGAAYNKAFVNNWEYYPLTDNELKFVVNNIVTIADARLIKVITHDDEAVGFLFAFPDVSSAMQRSGGRLLPFGLLDILLEMRRTHWVAINGAGILPEFHGRGGNALLYSEMEKTMAEFQFQHADLVQVADTAVQMRSDLENIGGKVFKTHRVFRKNI